MSQRVLTPDLFVGLMSGTSLDGVDAVLVDLGGTGPKLIATRYSTFPPELRTRLLALHEPTHDEIHHAAVTANDLAYVYAESIERLLEQAGVPAAAVHAIGCHGQTVRHKPRSGYSVQLNSPALLAELSKIAVVADFRSRDIAAGGEGAPLVPAFHDAIFRTPGAHRVVLNIGGIANVTNLKPGEPTRGFDCGPGNILLDAWTQRNLALPYDDCGNWSARGSLIRGLLGMLRAHPFFSQAPPKSCGRDEFNLRWVESRLDGNENVADVQATLLELTASTIADSIRAWCGGDSAELVVCGGGAHNAALLARLSVLLPQTHIEKSDTFGIGADWVEAFAFAWLARQTLLGLSGNLPEVTGARGPRVLGAIYHA